MPRPCGCVLQPFLFLSICIFVLLNIYGGTGPPPVGVVREHPVGVLGMASLPHLGPTGPSSLRFQVNRGNHRVNCKMEGPIGQKYDTHTTQILMGGAFWRLAGTASRGSRTDSSRTQAVLACRDPLYPFELGTRIRSMCTFRTNPPTRVQLRPSAVLSLRD